MSEKTPLREASGDVEAGATEVARTKLRMANMCCESEATLARKTLDGLAGVVDVKVNVVGRVAYVKHRTSTISSAALCDALNGVKLGASVQAAAEKHDAAGDPPDLVEIGFVAFLVALFSAGLAVGGRPALLVVVALGALPLARDAARAASAGRLDVNVLMLVAVAGALQLGDAAEAATVCVVACLAKVAEAECLRRVRNALQDATAGDGADAATRPDGSTVDAAALKKGDVVVVRAGERVPVDGVVLFGKAAVDESALTGESEPVEKLKGSSVSRGTVATQGFVKVEATAARSEDGASELARLVDEAQATSTKTQDLIGRFAEIFTPFVLLCAIAVGCAVSVRVALVMLVLACPCALVLAAPIVVVASLGGAAKRGVLVKSAIALEQLAAVDLLCADKTGTITQGRCRVVAVASPPGVDDKTAARALQLAGSLEAVTAHPLAAAIVNEAVGCVGEADASALSDDVSSVVVTSGAGVAGVVDGVAVKAGTAAHCGLDLGTGGWAPGERGATTIFVAVAGQIQLALAIVDPVRDEAPRALFALQRLGLGLAILTGDRPEVVDGVLKDLERRGVGDVASVDVRATCKPADKLDYVRHAQRAGRVVLFVGDGINDAPALAASDVGAAMGAGGTAMAVDAADVAIMTDDLERLPDAVALGRNATRLIKQNVFLAVAIKLAVVVAAFYGEVPLYVAVLADLLSLLLVVGNGARPLFCAP
mmetsp:Transcript_11059/g.33277  ORF Transcript_11059/g.33277 Transcript_11059/m.33277 type:complete len:714 (-) Transcript_11059:124-2265(-)